MEKPVEYEVILLTSSTDKDITQEIMILIKLWGVYIGSGKLWMEIKWLWEKVTCRQHRGN